MEKSNRPNKKDRKQSIYNKLQEMEIRENAIILFVYDEQTVVDKKVGLADETKAEIAIVGNVGTIFRAFIHCLDHKKLLGIFAEEVLEIMKQKIETKNQH